MNVEGEEHLTRLLTARDGKPQSAVVIGNHQRSVTGRRILYRADVSSFVDILFLGRIFPRRASIMAKKELKWMPLLGQYCKLRPALEDRADD